MEKTGGMVRNRSPVLHWPSICRGQKFSPQPPAGRFFFLSTFRNPPVWICSTRQHSGWQRCGEEQDTHSAFPCGTQEQWTGTETEVKKGSWEWWGPTMKSSDPTGFQGSQPALRKGQASWLEDEYETEEQREHRRKTGLKEQGTHQMRESLSPSKFTHNFWSQSHKTPWWSGKKRRKEKPCLRSLLKAKLYISILFTASGTFFQVPSRQNLWASHCLLVPSLPA